MHANTPVDALMRIEAMVNMAGFNLPGDYIKKFISSALDVVVQIERMVDGSRKIVSLQEITGMEGSVITMQEIFSFDQSGVDKDGAVSASPKKTVATGPGSPKQNENSGAKSKTATSKVPNSKTATSKTSTSKAEVTANTTASKAGK